MDEGKAAMPGAFPEPAPEETPTSTRVPKKRFVGRRTAEAQAKQRQQDGNSSVEETTAIIQNSMLYPIFGSILGCS